MLMAISSKAATKHKHSPSRAQGSRRSAHASTKPAPSKSAKAKPQTSTRKHRKAREAFRLHSASLKPSAARPLSAVTVDARSTALKRSKASSSILWRSSPTGEYHSIDVRFQDKTALHFVINPGFSLETEYADWKDRQLASYQALAADPQRNPPDKTMNG